MVLNQKQQEMVNTIKGQVLVISCPGSGKTTSIIARVNALQKAGVSPQNILVITFTKEAALHMENKYKSEYNDTGVHFGTIHSICYEVLRQVDGYSRDDLFLETDKWSYFSNILYKKIPADAMEEYIKALIAGIGYVKNKGEKIGSYTPEQIKEEDFQNLFSMYEEHKKELGKIDFDDMLLLTRKIFIENGDILERYQKKYKYIMIDEYQDTNKVQADIFYMLAGENGNLCVVGDDDQSIYGFRSADSSIMLDFPKKYPNCKVIYLDTNYRSEPEIIEKAGNIIKNNRIRFNKKFIADKTDKAVISVQGFNDSIMQRDMVLDTIFRLQKEGKQYEDMAILYRTNKQNLMYVQKLMKDDIPFYTTEAIKDYHHEFVFQDILAYHRLARKIYKRGDLQRVLNRPSRYLKTSLFNSVNFNLLEMLDACKNATNISVAKQKVYEMHEDVSALRDKTPKAFLYYLYNVMGYKEAAISFAKYCGKDVEEIKELMKILEEEAEGFNTMEDWISYADAYAARLQKKRKEKNGICLSTYHSAKGLEWNTVFLIDANEGYAPFKKAETEEEIEEERRLFYVAFTRAAKEVHITYLKSHGNREILPSRFIAEAGLLENTKKFQNNRKTKFYAVKRGRKTCIVTTWDECKDLTDGYPNPIFKKFNTYEEAKIFIDN